MSVLAGKTEGFVVIPVTSGIILTVRACLQLCMESRINKSLSKSIASDRIRCGMPNFSTSLYDTTASLEVSNRFETLSSLSEPDSPVPDHIAHFAAV